MSAAAGESARVRIWDLPVRVTHGLIAVVFAVQWWTGTAGKLEWHRWSGYTMIALLVFRVLWGVFGSSTARFAGFVRGPVAVLAYARKLLSRGDGRFRVGHNPIGGWSVVLMLVLLIVQVGLGMFSVDTDGLESGPLADRVSFETGRVLAHRHAFVFNLLLAVVALHVAAAVFYLVVRRDNLLTPMVTGSRTGETGDAPMTPAGPLRFVLAAAIAVACRLVGVQGVQAAVLSVALTARTPAPSPHP